MKFKCPKCGAIYDKPGPPVLVAYRCESGRCTYAALEAVREAPE